MKQECTGTNECRVQGNPCIYQVLCQGPRTGLAKFAVCLFFSWVHGVQKNKLNFWTGHWGYDQPFSNLRTAWVRAYVTSRDNELSASGTDLTNEFLIWLDIGRKIPTVTTVQCKKSLESRVLHWQPFCMTSYLLNDLSKVNRSKPTTAILPPLVEAAAQVSGALVCNGFWSHSQN